MSAYPESFDHMLAAWNEPDHTMVRAHLAPCVLSGFDVAQTNESGRIVCVIGFFGPFPDPSLG